MHTGGVIKRTDDAGVSQNAIDYVPKDDVVLPELAVREIILHSARIRLPQTGATKLLRGM